MNTVSIPDKTDKSILQNLEEAKRTAVEKVVMTVLYNYYLKQRNSLQCVVFAHSCTVINYFKLAELYEPKECRALYTLAERKVIL